VHEGQVERGGGVVTVHGGGVQAARGRGLGGV
jgi:hypothetical protein